jgi:hypothetical protein
LRVVPDDDCAIALISCSRHRSLRQG